jgi:hypothetical protein
MSVNGTAVNESVKRQCFSHVASAAWRGPPIDGGSVRSQIEAWLRETPTMSGAEVLRRAREVGYRGGKSALYELVRRLRIPVSASLSVVPSNGSR